MTPERELALLEIIRNESACVEKGKAIDDLVKAGRKQLDIAGWTDLSTSAISHLKKIFLNLPGQARDMCKAGRMNGDACYRLASASDRERVFQSAVKIRKKKDAQRHSGQNTGPKGRQTPLGQITDEDVKEAIEQVPVKHF